MKIGAFAKANGVSIDTIRHYMDLGLLLPEKKGGQYDFASQDQYQLEMLKDLKSCGFTLAEAKDILYYSQFAKVEARVSQNYYQRVYEKKQRQILEEIEVLSHQAGQLKTKLSQLKDQRQTQGKNNRGLPMKLLSLLACPSCGKALTLSEGRIENNLVVAGSLGCDCGKSYEIVSGILMDKALQGDSAISPGLAAEEGGNLYFEYIQETDQRYLKALYEGAQWMSRRLSPADFDSKLILEIGTGAGFFLRNVYEHLTQDSLYIAVDHSLETLVFLRDILESAPTAKPVVFFCCDMCEVPLQPGCIDTLVDASGSSNYYFDHDEWLLPKLEKLLSVSARIYSSYIFFRKRLHHGDWERRYLKHFLEETVLDLLDQSQILRLEENRSEDIPCSKLDKYEAYRQLGDVVYFYQFIGRFQR